ncbi:pyruvate dehydrogenase E1 component (beta subunit) [Mycolicibacterium mageritense DSM 44476 = CIP 104973]
MSSDRETPSLAGHLTTSMSNSPTTRRRQADHLRAQLLTALATAPAPMTTAELRAQLSAQIGRPIVIEKIYRVPIPYAKHLEEAALPQPEKIVAAVRGLFGEDRRAGAQRPGMGEER